MNLISWPQDRELKTLIGVISVDSNLANMGRSGRVDTLDQSLDYKKKKGIVKGNKFANP
jgi:hypothetical protein